jgi:CRISPR-associated protein Cmr6
MPKLKSLEDLKNIQLSQSSQPPPKDQDSGGTPATGGNAGHYFFHGRSPDNGDKLRITDWDYGQSLAKDPLPKFLGASGARLDAVRFNGIDYADWFDARDWQQGGNFRYFELTTAYPGMVLGSGYAHPAFRRGDTEPGDFQIGFFFDWTTGLPVIPGSTVKGILRAVFPKSRDRQAVAAERRSYLAQRISEIVKQPVPDSDGFVTALEDRLFQHQGKDWPVNIFHDAYPRTAGQDGRVFAEDYITPHGGPGRNDPFKDPIPLRFLKIGPGVTFRFQFRLSPIELDGVSLKPGHLSNLFKRILTDFGIGAKRNTGYGVLVEA